MSIPHGCRLVRRILSETVAGRITASAGSMPGITLSESLLKDVFNICHGIYSPLEGFVGKDDLESILDSKRLTGDIPWTIPIVLDVNEDSGRRIKDGDDIALMDDKGSLVAILHLTEKYELEKERFAGQVFGTLDPKHPGVARVMQMKDILLAGPVDLVRDPELPFSQYTLDPMETRVLFREKGWRDVAGFQTRNVPHLGHEYCQKTALAFTDGIFINPVIGRKKPGDFLDEVILDSYRALLDHYYLKDRGIMAVLHLEMRYAGPREAIFHAIIRKNFGCTHFIVGRDHAGVGSYYDPFAAHEIFDEFPDIGITPLFFRSFFHCRRCGGVSNEKTCPHGEESRINFSGTAIRDCLCRGETPPSEMMRKEVAEAIMRHERMFVE